MTGLARSIHAAAIQYRARACFSHAARRCARLALLALMLPIAAPHTDAAPKPRPATELWALQPLVRPDVPAGETRAANPIDAFLAASARAHGVPVAAPAGRRVLLRRVHLDLTGIPPTPEEQETFERDPSPDAYEKVVDHLLAGEQHAVRYARHWLDVLRYADEDERLTPSAGMHLWRDWVIHALAEDLPYDQFVRAQLTGFRDRARTQVTATGHRVRVEPRPDDLFALGFLSRGAGNYDGTPNPELALSAVDTVSSAFMGMTVACAKCHDHFYDPITRRDYYAMKALFDPLVPRKVILGTAAERMAAGRARAEMERRKAALEGTIAELTGSRRQKLYDERLAMLPAEIQAVIRKPEAERTPAEQKIADDYYPVLRIDPGKIAEVLPEGDRQKYQDLRKQLDQASSAGANLPVFWTVEVDPARELQKSYLLTSGDPDRPERNHEVEPGWPFGPARPDLREGRVEAFSDWLTAPGNPLFARVAVNRIWQWHFGEPLHSLPSDVGSLAGTPAQVSLLNWLACEFVARGFSMRQLHRLIVTSEAYRRSSDPGGAPERNGDAVENSAADFVRMSLRRLDAEAVWDSIFSAAGILDPAVGGPSFSFEPSSLVAKPGQSGAPVRRAAYLMRGYSASREVMPAVLQTFDADDGRAPCPVRTRTITAPQSLFLMNSPEVARATEAFGHRLESESHGDLAAAVDLGYRIAINRPPTAAEREQALRFLGGDHQRLPQFAWILFNLDEFVFVR